jgi:plastocyanin
MISIRKRFWKRFSKPLFPWLRKSVSEIFCVELTLFIFSLGFCAQAWAGTITGTIKYSGEAPPAKFVHMDADPVCYAVNKGNTHAPVLVLGDNNTLGNVFVYVKSGLTKTYPPPDQAAVITQAGCNYSPHVSGVMVGQKVKFLNPDGTLHNVHAMCQINPEFNDAMPDFRKEMEKVFNKPEFMFQVRCDVHPWMKAWIAVMPNPFFAVTGPDGKFEIKDLPAGTYTIEAWHEKLGPQTATITVKDQGTEGSDFTFSEPK